MKKQRYHNGIVDIFNYSGGSFLPAKSLTLFFLILFLAAAPAMASPLQEIRISIQRTDVPLSEVFKEIEQKTDYSFLIRNNDVDISRKVSINARNKSVAEILGMLFDKQGIDYKVDGKRISVYKAIDKEGQPRKVTGRVVDASREPVIGASIIIEGTSLGTVTDIDGNFSLEVPDDNAMLTLSYIGYKTRTISVRGRNSLNIALQEDAQALDEVVVVGYGTQKKVNVVGSISQVNSETLENRSTPNISNALTGQMPGVTIIQRSGRPGASSGSINVRGVGSFGATPSALVLIDGMPGTLDDVNMQDVESISVLKDASTAAIYGARAANGVILVTTKTGREGKASVNYNGYVGFNTPTEMPKFVDSWRWAELYNEATGSEIYTSEEIQKFKDGSDPDNYGNANYLDEVLSRNGFQTGHDISINGGSNKTKYAVSFGYLSQNGLVEKNNYSRYNARINLINQLLPNLKLTTRAAGMYSLTKEPSVPGGNPAASDMLGIIQLGFRFPGLTPSILSDGSYAVGPEMTGTPLAWVQSDSFMNSSLFTVDASVKLDYSPIKDLNLSVMGGYQKAYTNSKTYHSTLKLADGRETGPSSLSESYGQGTYKMFQATADYTKAIGVHNLSVLAGYSWEQKDYTDLSAFRDKFPGNDLPYINAGSPDNQKSYGGGFGWAIQSYFGRLQYNYAERYLLEATFRYDGSSRFPADNRFGFFPSAALGWRISEESFFKENENLNWISSLKLKASWGRLGNHNISNYPYQTVYSLGENYSFGGTVNQGAAVLTATDPTLKWEETETVDAGLEAILWDGLLNFSVSWFNRNTYDILYKPAGSVSSILGMSVSEQNTGKLRNRGWEIEIGHKNKIGDFSYAVNGNLSVINNEVITLGVGNVEQLNGLVGNGSSLFIGYPMNLYYGYRTDGVFLDQADIDNWADQSAINPNPVAGDIRYKDISGPDGKPDGKVDPNYDRVPLGTSIPKFTFGLNLNMEYKGVDLAVLFQGVADVNGYLQEDAGWALRNRGKIQVWQAEGRFDPEHPTRYPKYPRLQEISGASTGPNYQISDFWMLDASYLRIKNIQLGYTFPKKVVERLKINNFRVYVQAENPFSFNRYREGWDPEINTSGNYYPILSTYTFGVNLKF